MSEKLHGYDKAVIREETEKAGPAITKRLRRWKGIPQMAPLMAEEERLQEVVL